MSASSYDGAGLRRNAYEIERLTELGRRLGLPGDTVRKAIGAELTRATTRIRPIDWPKIEQQLRDLGTHRLE